MISYEDSCGRQYNAVRANPDRISDWDPTVLGTEWWYAPNKIYNGRWEVDGQIGEIPMRIGVENVVARASGAAKAHL